MVAIGFVCFHLYTAIFGVLPGIGQKSVHLGCLLVIFYITAIMESKKTADRIFLVLMGLFGVAGTVKRPIRTRPCRPALGLSI